MADDVARKVREIVAELAMVPVEDVTDDATPEALGVDSMGLVEAIFAIEEAFDIQVPFNANEPARSEFDVSTIGAIIRAVERLVARQRA
jgi:acyl carrier protein